MSMQDKAETESSNTPDGAVVPYLPSIGRLLGFASKVAGEAAEKRLASSGLTLGQWVLMTALWRRDGLRVGELAAYHGATEPSTSNLIARMEKKGFLERRHDMQDRRQVRVFLTELGQSKSHLIDIYKEMNALYLAGFSGREKEQFTAMLERVIENAQSGSGRQVG